MSITYGLKAPPFGRIMHTLDSRDDVFVAPQSIVSVGEILSLARRIAPSLAKTACGSWPASKLSSVSFLIAIGALHQRNYGPAHKIPDSPNRLCSTYSRRATLRLYRFATFIARGGGCAASTREPFWDQQRSSAREPINARSPNPEALGDRRWPTPSSPQPFDSFSIDCRSSPFYRPP
jgi:hypothetical protein